jgi:hypothetical protein
MATGSKWPFPSVVGRPDLLRASLYKQIDIVAGVGVQLGVVNTQWDALRKGQDVTFTTAQLKRWYPRGNAQHPSLPPDLDAAQAWTLLGDDVLVPAS